MLREVAEINVFMESPANIPRNADLEGAFGVVIHETTTSIAWHLRDAGRIDNVIAEPGMLFNIGAKYALRLLSVNEQLILRQQPRFVDKETAFGIPLNEAAGIQRENRSILADMNGVGLRAQQRHWP